MNDLQMGEVLWQLLNFGLLVGFLIVIVVLIVSLFRFNKNRKEQLENCEKINYIEEKLRKEQFNGWVMKPFLYFSN